MKPLKLGYLFLLFLLLACRKDKVDDVNPLIPPGDGHDHGAPIENTASVEGYSDKVAYYPGDSVRLMISTAADSMVSIAKRNRSNQFHIFPSPSNGELMISPSKNNVEYSITLFDAEGDLRLSTKSILAQEFKMDLRSLASGIYFLKIISSSGMEMHKIVLN
ncbi:MAG: T9SS type A sorting domain-containing protein [Flavobacteriales bacterium]|jgi:hypothetical protein|nr:T9SS type A sorting domain-containing protein [Flavobacteriales bacterium]NCG30096.1 T9SS type A sorting domain-containing protein [Bacteroidota bacterium]MBT4931131.1 T9SS type A sorting domain-containing protein [Flavobacteriales bacterium]MBT5133461.1 T9SS type A sorting domain-containing protein [Flavobacteriales bacterium]MBT5978121.1 T9SS type A sorting domain-containing protein [Flavobacteriales bacterium]